MKFLIRLLIATWATLSIGLTSAFATLAFNEAEIAIDTFPGKVVTFYDEAEVSSVIHPTPYENTIVKVDTYSTSTFSTNIAGSVEYYGSTPSSTLYYTIVGSTATQPAPVDGHSRQTIINGERYRHNFNFNAEDFSPSTEDETYTVAISNSMDFSDQDNVVSFKYTHKRMNAFSGSQQNLFVRSEDPVSRTDVYERDEGSADPSTTADQLEGSIFSDYFRIELEVPDADVKYKTRVRHFKASGTEGWTAGSDYWIATHFATPSTLHNKVSPSTSAKTVISTSVSPITKYHYFDEGDYLVYTVETATAGQEVSDAKIYFNLPANSYPSSTAKLVMRNYDADSGQSDYVLSTGNPSPSTTSGQITAVAYSPQDTFELELPSEEGRHYVFFRFYDKNSNYISGQEYQLGGINGSHVSTYHSEVSTGAYWTKTLNLITPTNYELQPGDFVVVTIQNSLRVNIVDARIELEYQDRVGTFAGTDVVSMYAVDNPVNNSAITKTDSGHARDVSDSYRRNNPVLYISDKNATIEVQAPDEAEGYELGYYLKHHVPPNFTTSKTLATTKTATNSANIGGNPSVAFSLEELMVDAGAPDISEAQAIVYLKHPSQADVIAQYYIVFDEKGAIENAASDFPSTDWLTPSDAANWDNASYYIGHGSFDYRGFADATGIALKAVTINIYNENDEQVDTYSFIDDGVPYAESRKHTTGLDINNPGYGAPQLPSTSHSGIYTPTYSDSASRSRISTELNKHRNANAPRYGEYLITIVDQAGNEIQTTTKVVLNGSCRAYDDASGGYKYLSDYVASSNVNPEPVAYYDPTNPGSGYSTAQMDNPTLFANYTPYVAGQQVGSNSIQVLYRIDRALSYIDTPFGFVPYSTIRTNGKNNQNDPRVIDRDVTFDGQYFYYSEPYNVTQKTSSDGCGGIAPELTVPSDKEFKLPDYSSYDHIVGSILPEAGKVRVGGINNGKTSYTSSNAGSDHSGQKPGFIDTGISYKSRDSYTTYKTGVTELPITVGYADEPVTQDILVVHSQYDTTMCVIPAGAKTCTFNVNPTVRHTGLGYSSGLTPQVYFFVPQAESANRGAEGQVYPYIRFDFKADDVAPDLTPALDTYIFPSNKPYSAIDEDNLATQDDTYTLGTALQYINVDNGAIKSDAVGAFDVRTKIRNLVRKGLSGYYTTENSNEVAEGLPDGTYHPRLTAYDSAGNASVYEKADTHLLFKHPFEIKVPAVGAQTNEANPVVSVTDVNASSLADVMSLLDVDYAAPMSVTHADKAASFVRLQFSIKEKGASSATLFNSFITTLDDPSTTADDSAGRSSSPIFGEAGVDDAKTKAANSIITQIENAGINTNGAEYQATLIVVNPYLFNARTRTIDVSGKLEKTTFDAGTTQNVIVRSTNASGETVETLGTGRADPNQTTEELLAYSGSNSSLEIEVPTDGNYQVVMEWYDASGNLVTTETVNSVASGPSTYGGLLDESVAPFEAVRVTLPDGNYIEGGYVKVVAITESGTPTSDATIILDGTAPAVDIDAIYDAGINASNGPHAISNGAFYGIDKVVTNNVISNFSDVEPAAPIRDGSSIEVVSFAIDYINPDGSNIASASFDVDDMADGYDAIAKTFDTKSGDVTLKAALGQIGLNGSAQPLNPVPSSAAFLKVYTLTVADALGNETTVKYGASVNTSCDAYSASGVLLTDYESAIAPYGHTHGPGGDVLELRDNNNNVYYQYDNFKPDGTVVDEPVIDMIHRFDSSFAQQNSPFGLQAYDKTSKQPVPIRPSNDGYAYLEITVPVPSNGSDSGSVFFGHPSKMGNASCEAKQGTGTHTTESTNGFPSFGYASQVITVGAESFEKQVAWIYEGETQPAFVVGDQYAKHEPIVTAEGWRSEGRDAVLYYGADNQMTLRVGVDSVKADDYVVKYEGQELCTIPAGELQCEITTDANKASNANDGFIRLIIEPKNASAQYQQIASYVETGLYLQTVQDTTAPNCDLFAQYPDGQSVATMGTDFSLEVCDENKAIAGFITLTEQTTGESFTVPFYGSDPSGAANVTYDPAHDPFEDVVAQMPDGIYYTSITAIDAAGNALTQSQTDKNLFYKGDFAIDYKILDSNKDPIETNEDNADIAHADTYPSLFSIGPGLVEFGAEYPVDHRMFFDATVDGVSVFSKVIQNYQPTGTPYIYSEDITEEDVFNTIWSDMQDAVYDYGYQENKSFFDGSTTVVVSFASEVEQSGMTHYNRSMVITPTFTRTESVAEFDDGSSKIKIPAYRFIVKDENGHNAYRHVHMVNGSASSEVSDVVVTLDPSSTIPLEINGIVIHPGTSYTFSGYDFGQTGGNIDLPIQVAVDGDQGEAFLTVDVLDNQGLSYTSSVTTWDAVPTENPDPFEPVGDGEKFSLNIQNGEAQGCKFVSDPAPNGGLDMVHEPQCFIVWDELSDNLHGSTEGEPTLIGRVFGDGEISYAYSIFLIDQYGQTKLIKQVPKVTIPVTGAIVEIELDGVDQTYEAYVENVDLNFNSADRSICQGFTTVEYGAETNHLDSARTYCYVEWGEIPVGLEDPVQNQTAELRGTIDNVGDNPVTATIYAYDGEGNRYVVANIDEIVETTLPTPPKIILQEMDYNENGKAVVNHSGGSFGRARIQGAGAELQIELDDGVNQQSITLPEGAVRPNRDYIELLSTERLPVWYESQYKIKAFYTVAPDNFSEEIVPFAAVPDVSLRITQDIAEPDVLDTDDIVADFSVQDDSGLMEFENAVGEWTTYLATKTGFREYSALSAETVQSFTAPLPCNTSTPSCVAATEFTGSTTHPTGDFKGGNVYTIADVVSPNGEHEAQIASNPIYMSVLKGGPIVASVITRRTWGVAPYRAMLQVDFEDYKNQNASGDIVWEISHDGGPYEVVESTRPTQLTYTFLKGVHHVRAKLTNKNDGTETYTEILEVTAYPGFKVNIEGPRRAFIDMNAQLNAVITPKDPSETITDDDMIVEWSLDNHETFSHPGKTIDLTLSEEGRVDLVLRVRSVMAPDEKAAYTFKRWNVTFSPVKPGRGAIYGPNSMEYGSEYEIRAVDIPPYLHMDREMNGEWVLPDGSTLYGETLMYSPTEDDLALKVASIGRRVWFDGYESDAHITYRKFKITEYVLPDFQIGYTARPTIAPTQVTLSPRAINYSGVFRDGDFIWSVPGDWTLESQSSSGVASFTAPTAGDHQVELTVNDYRGNTTSSTETITLTEPEEHTLGLRISKSNGYDRAPLDVVVRPIVQGGHPYERVDSYEYELNGVLTENNRGIMYATLGEGDHNVQLTINTSHGNTVSYSEVITVHPNQLPNCGIQALDKRHSNVLELRAQCVDPDGRVSAYQWTVNGVTYGNNSYRFLAPAEKTENDFSIGLTVTDDSGETASFNEVFNLPPYEGS